MPEDIRTNMMWQSRPLAPCRMRQATGPPLLVEAVSSGRASCGYCPCVGRGGAGRLQPARDRGHRFEAPPGPDGAVELRRGAPGSIWRSRRVAIGVAQRCALGPALPNRQFNLH